VSVDVQRDHRRVVSELSQRGLHARSLTDQHEATECRQPCSRTVAGSPAAWRAGCQTRRRKFKLRNGVRPPAVTTRASGSAGTDSR
jgi:hypothetical protein